MTAEEKFAAQLTDPLHADIAGHLWTLRRYASASRSIVEMGVHDCSTTLAFLLGRPCALYSFDLERQPEVDQMSEWAEALGVDFRFHLADSRKVTIPNVDLLFLDTDHVARTVATELEKHSPYVNRTIILHDTAVHGERGRLYPDEAPAGPERDFGGEGLWDGAIGPFLRKNRGWRLHSHTQESNGLTILMKEWG